ncbi:MAG: hypothetical protein AAB383_00140 [Patescibacteria group bacterium]|mgnify:CR=1 FL=1
MKAGSIVNLVLIIALSAGLTLGSFTAFPKTDVLSATEGDLQEQLESAGAVRVDGRDSVSLLEMGSAEWTWNSEAKTVETELANGTLFFATLADDFTVEVSTPFVRVTSQNSTALVRMSESGEAVEIFALEHPSLVTFLLDGGELNSLLIPTGTSMKVPSSKITETLGRLRLTKLTKEFPVFPFETAELTEAEQVTFTDSQAAYDENSLSFLQDQQKDSHFGPALTGLGSALNKGYSLFRDTLTVLPSAENRLNEAQKEKYLVYGMSNLLFGDKVTGEKWVTDWKNAQPENSQVEAIYSALFFALPGDDLYLVKEAAAELLYPQEEPLVALRREFQEIEGLLSRGSLVEAQSAYQKYQDKFEIALQSGTLDDEAYLDDISREYMLLELLLRSHAVFYTGDSVKLLTELETKILSLAGSDEDLDEERQAFVQSKLRYLENLFNFVVDRKIAVEDASDLANDLVAEAEQYLGSITSEVAVRSYFQTKLQEYDLSIQFMNSPEFYSYDSFDEGLKDYQAKVDDLANLNEYIQGLRSGEESSATLTLEAAIAAVENDLRSNGIQYKEVESLGDSANRLFQIVSGHTGGYAFEANYDRETKILYDTVVEGELRFSTGLTLENANSVIETAMKDAELTPEEEEETPVEEEGSSLTEDVAISRVEKDFEAADLKLGAFTFDVVDLEENTFTFEGVMTEAALVVSGSYDLDTGLVTEVLWELDGEPQNFPDIGLLGFEDALYATYQALTAE